MGYFAVKGGTDAIAKARELVEFYRIRSKTTPLEIGQIKCQFRLALDKIMGEGSLYAPEHAAIALKQVEGDLLEAAFILRAFRATLDRGYYSDIVDTRNMFVQRRISSTFKDIPDGQLLGPTRDYKHHFLDPNVTKETRETVNSFLFDYGITIESKKLEEVLTFGRVSDFLIKEGILQPVDDEGSKKVVDITRDAIKFPSPRSASLQMLARAETGGLTSLAYAAMRGHGSAQGCVGELRVGLTQVHIRDVSGRRRYIGKIKVTECEIISRLTKRKKGTIPYLSIGYGLCFGHNENKAISMGLLDRAMRNPDENILTQEFVLYHTEGVESMGFTNHLKLPHYVTFQAGLKTMRAEIQRHTNKDNEVKQMETPK